MSSLPSYLRTCVSLVVVAAATAFSPLPALAWHRHHSSHATYAHADPRAYANPQGNAYAGPYAEWGGWQAAVIAHRAVEMQNAPGVTNELAPDNIATATGGPAGGVPGFSGH